MRSSSFCKFVCVAMLVGILPVAMTGCFGSMSAFHKVHQFNKDVSEEKWIQELVFVVLGWAYPVAWSLDAIIFNTIEFWTGENPLSAGETRVIEGPNGEQASVTMREDGLVDVTVTNTDGSEQQLTLEHGCHEVTAYDCHGKKAAVAKHKDGKVKLVTE
ncbi:MAG: DUF3332 family protein [Planctomycetota bacterium]